MTKPTHYLRFVQAIVLAAAVPACSVSSETPSTPSTPSAPPAPKEEASEAPVATAEEKTEPAADAGADAELPFSSGPMMPPVCA
jgi:hypothetical protein